MQILLTFAKSVDCITERVGRVAMWLILVCVLLSAGNAIARKFWNMSSNAMLEIQWYLFAAVFLFCAAAVLKRNAHVRIDIFFSRLSLQTQAWVDVLATLLFLLPLSGLVIYLSWHVFMNAWYSHEVSSNAGGLVIWPARLFVPLGFSLLLLQGISELIKLSAFLRGKAPFPYEVGVSSNERHAQEAQQISQGEM